jgi:hypothetical protein
LRFAFSRIMRIFGGGCGHECPLGRVYVGGAVPYSQAWRVAAARCLL